MQRHFDPKVSLEEERASFPVQDDRVTIFTKPSDLGGASQATQQVLEETAMHISGDSELDGSASTIAADPVSSSVASVQASGSPGQTFQSTSTTPQRFVDTSATIPPEASARFEEASEYLTLSHLTATPPAVRDAAGCPDEPAWPKIGKTTMPVFSDAGSGVTSEVLPGGLLPSPARVAEAEVHKQVSLSQAGTSYGTVGPASYGTVRPAYAVGSGSVGPAVFKERADVLSASQQDWRFGAVPSTGDVAVRTQEPLGYLPLPGPTESEGRIGATTSFSTPAAVSDSLGASYIARAPQVVYRTETVGRWAPQRMVSSPTSASLASVPERTVLLRHAAPAAPAGVQGAGVSLHPRALNRASTDFGMYSQMEASDGQALAAHVGTSQAATLTQSVAPQAMASRVEMFPRQVVTSSRPTVVQRASSFAHGTVPMVPMRTVTVGESVSSHVGLPPRPASTIRYGVPTAVEGSLPRMDARAVPVYRVQTFSGGSIQTGQSFAYPAAGSFANLGPQARTLRTGEITVAEDIDHATRVHNMRRAVHESYGW